MFRALTPLRWNWFRKLTSSSRRRSTFYYLLTFLVTSFFARRLYLLLLCFSFSNLASFCFLHWMEGLTSKNFSHGYCVDEVTFYTNYIWIKKKNLNVWPPQLLCLPVHLSSYQLINLYIGSIESNHQFISVHYNILLHIS